MKKPVLLLDVDGVLNADSPDWGEGVKSGTAVAAGIKFKIVWSPRLISQINKLHESCRVEIRWSTTWCDYIGEIETLLGLPTFPCEQIPPRGETQQAKINAALDVVNSQTPLIWVDDNAIPFKDGAGWDSRFNHPVARKLFIIPDPKKGMQFPHIQEIDRFLKECESR